MPRAHTGECDRLSYHATIAAVFLAVCVKMDEVSFNCPFCLCFNLCVSDAAMHVHAFQYPQVCLLHALLRTF